MNDIEPEDIADCKGQSGKPQRLVTGYTLDGAPYSEALWGDGEHDDAPAIQEAWDRCGLIRLPPGIFRLDTPLFGKQGNNFGIIGAGAGIIDISNTVKTAGTILLASFAEGTVVTSAGYCQHPRFQGFCIDRCVEPINGYGLDMGVSNDQSHLSDLLILNQMIGINLATTGYSKAEFIRCERNRSNGFNITGQWQLDRCASLVNGGSGFAVTHALPTGNSLGQYKGLSTYGNKGYGITISGSVFYVRMSDSFFGGDSLFEIHVANDQPGAGSNVFTNVVIEAGLGEFGWVLGPTSGANSLINCSGLGNIRHGLISYCKFASIVGGSWQDHAGYGILIAGGKAAIAGVNLARNGFGLGATAECLGVTAACCNWSENKQPYDIAAAQGVQLWGNM